MPFRRFFIHIMIRVSLMTLTSVVLGLMVSQGGNENYFSVAGLSVLIFLQAYLLVRYVNKMNRDLSYFFSSVMSKNNVLRFPETKSDNIYKDLYMSLNSLNTLIQDISSQSEIRNQFLHVMIDHLNVGIISFDETGRVKILNQAARKILRVDEISHIQELDRKHADLSKLMNGLRPGQSFVHKLIIDDQTIPFRYDIYQLSFSAADLKIEGSIHKIVSFQNISEELDRKELDAWQKLIRVLTHEIMNSIGPIISLSGTLKGYFHATEGKSNPTDKLFEKTVKGLDAIQTTGKGLQDFVTNYRSLTNTSKLTLRSVLVSELFNKVENLIDKKLKKSGVELSVNIIPEELTIEMDESLVEQMLLNVVNNALDAMEAIKSPCLQIAAYYDSEKRPTIQVTDNGHGISPEMIDDIFIPFFTTKDKGSGIGLALSRNIMRLHGGVIQAFSNPGVETSFKMTF